MFRESQRKSLIGRQYEALPGLYNMADDTLNGGDAIDIRYAAGATIYMPQAGDTRLLTFLASYDGENFFQLTNLDSVPALAEPCCIDLPEQLFGAGWIKIAETNTGAGQFRISLKG